jgi:collagenase-like PrtC family protease
LPEVVAFCHRHGVKAHVALNTLAFTGELDDAAAYLRLLGRAGVDAGEATILDRGVEESVCARAGRAGSI